MVPAYFVPLERLPLTANGKIDQGALPLPAYCAGGFRFVYFPAQRHEQRLVSIWSELLGREQIGVNDNFFDRRAFTAGYAVVSRLRDTFQVRLSFTQFFLSSRLWPRWLSWWRRYQRESERHAAHQATAA